MRDVLFELGPVKIRSFGVMIVLGFFAALWLVRRRARAFGFDPNKVADLCLAVLFAGVIGARVVFILQELPTYIANPRSLLTLEFAGLTSFGGLLFAAGPWRSGRNGITLLPEDRRPACAAYLLAYAIGRVGCLLNGCCYGGACPTDLPWGVQFRGTQGPHHPAQIYEAIMSIAGLLIMLRFEKRLAPGQGIGLFFVVHGLARFIYEFWQAGTRLPGRARAKQLRPTGRRASRAADRGPRGGGGDDHLGGRIARVFRAAGRGAGAARGVSPGDLLASFRGRRALVVGDVMLDVSLRTRRSRLRRGPGTDPAPRARRTPAGGAANVARNLARFGAETTVVGVAGCDEARGCARPRSERGSGPGRHRPRSRTSTTRKTRVLADASHQVLRIDHESQERVGPEVENALLRTVEAELDGVDVVVLSDYVKGALTPRLIAEMVRAGRARGAAVVATPSPARSAAMPGPLS